jgi:CubicO group peptidase (beta-lactamase class C family)
MSDCYPAPERGAGWLCLSTPGEIRTEAGLTPWRVEQALSLAGEDAGSNSFGALVVRHGLLAGETYSRNTSNRKRFDLWSCTKSVTALAWGLVFSDGEGAGAGGERPTLDGRVYPLIPEAHPLSDPRKESITIRHLLSMTSGIPGEACGISGMPTSPGCGIFEYAFGHAPNRYNQWVAQLSHVPGEGWDYSDPAFAHLSPAFAAITSTSLANYAQNRLFDPIGVEAFWDDQGGSGFFGPHTNAHTGLHLSARDLARLGHLLLRGGAWKDQQLVPRAWLETINRSSQPYWPSYGLGFWTNAEGAWFPDLPHDIYGLAGYGGNRCYVVPSADLVVVRVGTGPEEGREATLLADVLAAVL